MVQICKTVAHSVYTSLPNCCHEGIFEHLVVFLVSLTWPGLQTNLIVQIYRYREEYFISSFPAVWLLSEVSETVYLLINENLGNVTLSVQSCLPLLAHKVVLLEICSKMHEGIIQPLLVLSNIVKGLDGKEAVS